MPYDNEIKCLQCLETKLAKKKNTENCISMLIFLQQAYKSATNQNVILKKFSQSSKKYKIGCGLNLQFT